LLDVDALDDRQCRAISDSVHVIAGAFPRRGFARMQMLTLGAGVSGEPSIRISLMSTGPSKHGKPSPHAPKN